MLPQHIRKASVAEGGWSELLSYTPCSLSTGFNAPTAPAWLRGASKRLEGNKDSQKLGEPSRASSTRPMAAMAMPCLGPRPLPRASAGRASAGDEPTDRGERRSSYTRSAAIWNTALSFLGFFEGERRRFCTLQRIVRRKKLHCTAGPAALGARPARILPQPSVNMRHLQTSCCKRDTCSRVPGHHPPHSQWYHPPPPPLPQARAAARICPCCRLGQVRQ